MNISVIHFLRIRSQRIQQEISCTPGVSLLLVPAPEILHASSFRRGSSRCLFSGWLGRVNNVTLDATRTGFPVIIFIKTGHHTCVGQDGTMITPVLLPRLTFSSTLVIRLKGGKAYNSRTVHDREKASTACASGSAL